MLQPVSKIFDKRHKNMVICDVYIVIFRSFRNILSNQNKSVGFSFCLYLHLIVLATALPNMKYSLAILYLFSTFFRLLHSSLKEFNFYCGIFLLDIVACS